MNLIVAVIFSILLLEQVQSRSNNSRIIEGTTVNPSEEKSYVAIFHRESKYQNVAICTGVIIHYRWILTAASCHRSVDTKYKNFRYIIGGNLGLPATGTTHYSNGEFINRIIYHPNYVISNGANDIALFQTVSDMLVQAFTITRTNPKLDINLAVILRAYGPRIETEGKDKTTDQLLQKESNLERIEQCRSLDPGAAIPLNKLCSLDTCCRNDQGGPLIDQTSGDLIGIISAPPGGRVTCNAWYTTYTNVFLYRTWIRRITGINDL